VDDDATARTRRPGVGGARAPEDDATTGTRGSGDAERGEGPSEGAVRLADLQRLMDDIYGGRDRARGVPATVAWLTEELGELAQAVRKGDRTAQLHELGDVLAWLASLANQLGIELEDAVARYADGCPRCGSRPCRCP
jgi:NTP pyrophosphatase (non-canonical NTP hydrolase)